MTNRLLPVADIFQFCELAEYARRVRTLAKKIAHLETTPKVQRGSAAVAQAEEESWPQKITEMEMALSMPDFENGGSGSLVQILDYPLLAPWGKVAVILKSDEMHPWLSAMYCQGWDGH